MSKMTALQRKHFPTTDTLPGVEMLLSTLSRTTSPKVHIALATSSHAGNFKLKTGHLEDRLFKYFDQEYRVLGDDPRIPQGRGKPCPDIYLLALETLNAGIRRRNEASGKGDGLEKEVTPAECLVFEDSVPGVESGRRAGMQVVWVPHPGLLNEYKGREKQVLAGMSGISDTDVATGEKGREKAGEIDDGWARQLASLEDFPYREYGIKTSTESEDKALL